MYEEINKAKEVAEQERLEGLKTKMSQPQQSQAVRNIDPFEKKRRLAMQQSSGEEIGSRKVTSRREE